MKLTPVLSLLFSLLILFTSCVDDSILADENSPLSIPKIKVITDKYEVGLFDMSLLELSSDKFPNNSMMNSFMFSEVMDSLVWDIPGEFTEKSHSTNFLAKRGQVFIRPSKYKFQITGYKAGKIISKDSLEITVVNKHDFLGINWNDLKDSTYATYDNTYLDYSLNLKTYSLPTGPMASLTYQVSSAPKDENLDIYHQRSKTILSNYMTELYGKPFFEKVELNRWKVPVETAFLDRFNYQLPTHVLPLAIWETKTTRIALLEKKDLDDEANNYCWIIAEPKK